MTGKEFEGGLDPDTKAMMFEATNGLSQRIAKDQGATETPLHQRPLGGPPQMDYRENFKSGRNFAEK